MYICPHGTGKSSTIHQSETAFMPTDKVIIALSGGADSVALLCLLQTLGYNCEAAHCNFHLRGKESDRDEAFVCQLCAKRQVPLHIVHLILYVQPKNDISPLKWQRGNYVTNGLKKYAEKRCQCHCRSSSPG